MLTQARLKESLHYDPQTGIFTRLETIGGTFSGTVAGSPSGHGYIKISLDRKKHYAHRLAWFYMTGEWPEFHIDHIDGDRSNNSFSNLRDVPHKVNMQNIKRARRDNKSTGLLGTGPHGNRFVAHIGISGKKKHLGVFDTVEEAHAAYLEAKRKHHEGCTI